MGYRVCKGRPENSLARRWEPMDADRKRYSRGITPYSTAFYFGMLEIEKKGQGQAGGMEVAEALGQVGCRETIDAFQFDDEMVFNHEVRPVLADDLTFVGYGVNGLGDDCYASKG